MNYRRPSVEVETPKWSQAVQPAAGVEFRLRAGYRRERFRNPAGLDVPAIAAAVPVEKLLDSFVTLLEPLGSVVDLILETSHTAGPAIAWRRDRIDSAVLASIIWEYEDLLVNDGGTGLAVVARGRPMEVQLDDHKCLFVYASRLRPFRDVLRAAGLRRRRELKFVFENPHVHRTSTAYSRQFRELVAAVDADLPRPNYLS